MEEKKIITVKQNDEYLQLDEYTVYQLTCYDKILFQKIAGQCKLTINIIDKWISEDR